MPYQNVESAEVGRFNVALYTNQAGRYKIDVENRDINLPYREVLERILYLGPFETKDDAQRSFDNLVKFLAKELM